MSTCIMHAPFTINFKPHACNFKGRPRELPYAVSFTGRNVAAEPFTQTLRRSGNYKPPLWSFDYIQSLSSEYTEESHLKRASGLIEQVKNMLLEEEKEDVVGQLELIDELQRLGISYHFHHKIKQILNSIYSDLKNLEEIRDLYATALAFRLLRQHGFKVSQEIFDCFKDKKGDFESSHGGDTKGLLQLYEASFLLTQGETTLEMAREFSSYFLRKKLDDDDDENLSLMVGHALELPLHWRTQAPYAKWSINTYGRRPDVKAAVLELAKLDFNILQATHTAELQHLSRWWKQTGLAEKLPFARDRVVECYLLTMGLFEPEYRYSRIIGTKVNALVTVIDDMFDVYGTMEELLLFNNVIQRWDDEAVEQLPKYMQKCFHALNNFINDMAYDVLNQHGFQIIPYLRKSWADLCTTYMQEAKWYAEGYKPRLQEYIDNAYISISVPVMLTHAFFALPENTIDHKEALACSFNKYHNIVRYSGTIARLANDLATSPDEMKRGDVPKSLQCCMNERDSGDIEEARGYLESMIGETWKKMNGQTLDSPLLPESYVRCAVEFGRIAHYVYQDGEDGHGVQNSRVKDRISGLLFDPIA